MPPPPPEPIGSRIMLSMSGAALCGDIIITALCLYAMKKAACQLQPEKGDELRPPGPKPALWWHCIVWAAVSVVVILVDVAIVSVDTIHAKGGMMQALTIVVLVLMCLLLLLVGFMVVLLVKGKWTNWTGCFACPCCPKKKGCHGDSPETRGCHNASPEKQGCHNASPEKQGFPNDFPEKDDYNDYPVKY